MSVISKRGHGTMGLQSKRFLTGILLVHPVKYYTFLDKFESSCIPLHFLIFAAITLRTAHGIMMDRMRWDCLTQI